MKNLRPFLLISLILLIAGTSFSQRKFEGRVIQVLDGKTVVIDSDSGKITAELQYIEIPEPENPLSKTVRGHLEDLLLDKKVAFHLQGFSFVKMTGQIYLGDVDIAQQMLRDGAAWHLPPGRSSQSKQASDLYDSTQELAKNEKRGIWSNENSNPAGLIRAERFESERKQEQYSREHPTTNSAVNQSSFVETNRREANKRPGKWADVNPKLGNVGALYSGYNAESKTGFLSTGISMVNLSNTGLDERFRNAKLYVDVTYWYKEESSGRTGTFVLTVISENDVAMFTHNQEMLLIIDNGRIAVGRGKRVESRSGDKVFEKLTFNISRSNMEHMAKDVTVMKIADQLLEPQSVRYILYNMLQFST